MQKVRKRCKSFKIQEKRFKSCKKCKSCSKKYNNNNDKAPKSDKKLITKINKDFTCRKWSEKNKN